MSPQAQANDWVRAHLGAIVPLGPDAEPWRIEATTSTGDVVLLRDLDDDRARLAPAEAVRRAYLAENS